MISHERRAGDRRRRPWSRRKNDRALLRRLIGIALFLFVVNVLLGAYVIDTLQRVDKVAQTASKNTHKTAKNTRALTIQVCTTNAAYRGALKREKVFARTASTQKERRTHRDSVDQLQRYLDVIEPLVDCSKFKISDPLRTPRHTPDHGNP